MQAPRLPFPTLNLTLPMKSKLAAAAVFLVGGTLSSHAVTVLFNTDFAALSNGDLNGQSSNGGGSSMTWTGDGNMDVSSGQLATAGGSTMWGALDGATQTTLNLSDEVWFSIDMRTNHNNGTNRFGIATTQGVFDTSATIGQRLGGTQMRLGPWNGSAPDVSGSVPGATTNAACETFTNTGWAANTWYTLVGKLTVNRSTGAADVFQFWFVPQGTFDYNNPGTPYITMNGIDLVGPTTQITGVVFQGNQGGNGYDNLTIAVPEPGSLLMGGLGLLALARRRRGA